MITVGVLHRNDTKLADMFIDRFMSCNESELCKIVWLDNASTDNSASHVKRKLRSDDIFISSETNLGVIGGRNKIFDIFSNESSTHLIFLDNDQIVSNGWLSHYTNSNKFDHALSGIEAWQLDGNFKPFKMCTSKDSSFSYVGCGGMCVPRECFNKVGKFDSKLGMAYFEDPDYCFRCIEAGIPIQWCPNKNILHLAHQTLGKMKERSAMFSNSAQYFRNKWRERKDLLMRGRNENFH